MAVRRERIPSSETSQGRRKAATTPQSRESKLVSLAEKLAERQLRDGTASSQVITHYLKMGSTREAAEQERIRGEVELQKAKIEAMASTQRLEEMYMKAMDAFRGYQGRPVIEESDDE